MAKSGKIKRKDRQLLESEYSEKEVMWLMKVPDEVYSALMEAQDGKTVGDLSVATGGQSGGKRKYNVRLQLAEGEEMTAFNMDELSKGPPVYAFDFDSTEDKFRRVGYVEKKTSLRPVDSEKYKEGIRKRSIAAMTATGVQRASNEESEGMIISAVSREVSFVLPAYTTNKMKTMERAKNNSELDPSMLKRNVLNTLVKVDRMTLKELSIKCGAPDKDVKAVLNDIGTYIKSGRFKHFWELKPEFKDNTREDRDEVNS